MQAEVGSGLGSKGRGRLALGVAHCFPDPSRPPWLRCLAPSPFPDLLRLRVVPLSLTLRRQGWRLPASWVTHGLVHPHPGSCAGHFPGCARACAPSPSATRVACCFFHPPQGCPPCRLNPHCWERGGSSAEWMGACTRARLLRPQLGEVGSGAACARGGCVGGTLHPCREEGVSTTPCIVPCARPLHAPPSDATMHMPSHMRDSARLAPKGGACRGRACGTARGVVLTRNGGGAALPFGAPASRAALGLCAAPMRRMG